MKIHIYYHQTTQTRSTDWNKKTHADADVIASISTPHPQSPHLTMTDTLRCATSKQLNYLLRTPPLITRVKSSRARLRPRLVHPECKF